MKTMIEEVVDHMMAQQPYYEIDQKDLIMGAYHVTRYLYEFSELGYGDFTINEILREVPPPEMVAVGD